ncbi:helix-turn-helix domain-containing protein [Fibrella sp. WM1]|uniref:terminase gpP N-terminus-related DNA-binding protein n=1 Tax=Fibrella musci TaxID=3242485 RepID=UPI003520C4E8
MTSAQLQEAGKLLYMLDVSGQKIASTLGVSETTVSNWVKRNGWREERAEGRALKQSLENGLLEVIEYAVDVLREHVKTNRSAGTFQPLDKGQVDALSKMYAQIKGKDMAYAAVVNLVKEIIQFVAAQNPDLARELVPYTNEFLATQAAE